MTCMKNGNENKHKRQNVTECHSVNGLILKLFFFAHHNAWRIGTIAAQSMNRKLWTIEYEWIARKNEKKMKLVFFISLAQVDFTVENVQLWMQVQKYKKKILLATREIDKSMEFTRGEKNQIKSVKGKNAKKSIIGIYFRYLLFHFASLAFCDLVCFLAITTANSSGKFSKFFCLLEANIPDPTTAQQKFNKIWGLN